MGIKVKLSERVFWLRQYRLNVKPNRFKEEADYYRWLILRIHYISLILRKTKLAVETKEDFDTVHSFCVMHRWASADRRSRIITVLPPLARHMDQVNESLQELKGEFPLLKVVVVDALLLLNTCCICFNLLHFAKPADH